MQLSQDSWVRVGWLCTTVCMVLGMLWGLAHLWHWRVATYFACSIWVVAASFIGRSMPMIERLERLLYTVPPVFVMWVFLVNRASSFRDIL
jgi:hypothetical protein